MPYCYKIITPLYLKVSKQRETGHWGHSLRLPAWNPLQWFIWRALTTFLQTPKVCYLLIEPVSAQGRLSVRSCPLKRLPQAQLWDTNQRPQHWSQPAQHRAHLLTDVKLSTNVLPRLTGKYYPGSLSSTKSGRFWHMIRINCDALCNVKEYLPLPNWSPTTTAPVLHLCSLKGQTMHQHLAHPSWTWLISMPMIYLLTPCPS